MLPSEDEMNEHSIGFLSVAPQSGTVSASVGVCFDQGRIAALNGFTIYANPYFADSEASGHRAWIDGFSHQTERSQ